jgi:hypothetical protein
MIDGLCSEGCNEEKTKEGLIRQRDIISISECKTSRDSLEFALCTSRVASTPKV